LLASRFIAPWSRPLNSGAIKKKAPCRFFYAFVHVVVPQRIAVLKEMLSDTYKEVRFAALKPSTTIMVEDGLFKGQTATFKEQKGNKTSVILNGLGRKLMLGK
jgi:hypothetical protein